MENKKNRKIPFLVLFIFDIIKLAVIAFLIVWPIHHFIFQPFYVVGPSMEPNFYDQDYLIVSKINYRLNFPTRGQVVVFHPPENDKDYLIKRVIGLPKEKILIEGGSVYIINPQDNKKQELNENAYLASGLTTPGKIELELAENEYYLLGDNRSMSMDSRSFGPVPRERITGLVFLRGWPFSAFGLIPSVSYSQN
ncbi:signal peptidase I [Patescibacteria group bacterium]|nr:signal peptidase I [Patescibacteria group bacterium]